MLYNNIIFFNRKSFDNRGDFGCCVRWSCGCLGFMWVMTLVFILSILVFVLYAIASGNIEADFTKQGTDFIRNAGVNLDNHYYDTLGLQVRTLFFLRKINDREIFF